MKKGLILLACALSASVLAGCGEAKDWSKEDKDLMMECLGGNVIPYYYVADQVVTDEYYDDYGCISVEAPKATDENLKEFEKILVAKEFTCVIASGEDEDSPYFMVYDLEKDDGYVFEIQAYIGKNGARKSGKWNVDAFYFKPVDDNSVEGLKSWDDTKKAVADYFALTDQEAPNLPDVSTSATSYDVIDYRYMVYAYTGTDIEQGYALVYLNGAKEAELAGVIAAFVAAGYAETEMDDGEGGKYTVYDNGKYSVDISYDEAEGDYPEDISIGIIASYAE